MSPFSEAFVRTTPFGVLAGIHVPPSAEGIPEELHADERAHAATLSPRRRPEWIGGRLAFARATSELGWPRVALGTGHRGEPTVPDGLAGSISHKDALAVALVARADGATLGVDLEALAPARPSIEEIALRPEEREALHRLPDAQRWHALVLAFAVKEALYKALHPRLRRYVRYDEAAVLLATGTPEIRLHLDGGPLFRTETRLEPVEGFVLACVRVTAAGS